MIFTFPPDFFFLFFQALPSLQKISDGSLDNVVIPNVKQEVEEDVDPPVDSLLFAMLNDKKEHAHKMENIEEDTSLDYNAENDAEKTMLKYQGWTMSDVRDFHGMEQNYGIVYQRKSRQ